MPATKIQDEAEVIRWFNEGRTYQWMCEEYQRKYDLRVVPSLWGNYRRRKGLTRRTVRDDELIPWAVREEHRWAYAVSMLRAEARKRAGASVRAVDMTRLAAWLENLAGGDLVVHYDPDTANGFFYVPRRRGVDTDLVRQPERPTGRRAAD